MRLFLWLSHWRLGLDFSFLFGLGDLSIFILLGLVLLLLLSQLGLLLCLFLQSSLLLEGLLLFESLLLKAKGLVLLVLFLHFVDVLPERLRGCAGHGPQGGSEPGGGRRRLTPRAGWLL